MNAELVAGAMGMAALLCITARVMPWWNWRVIALGLVISEGVIVELYVSGADFGCYPACTDGQELVGTLLVFVPLLTGSLLLIALARRALACSRQRAHARRSMRTSWR